MKRIAWLVPALAASALACEAESTGGSCEPGHELCECYPNRTCDSGLICSGSDICVEDDEDAGGSGDNGGSGGAGGAGGTSDAGGAGGTSDAGGSEGTGDAGGSEGTGDADGAGGSSAIGGSSGATNDAGGASSTDSGTDSGGASSTDAGTGGSTTTASGGSATTTESTTTGGSGGTGGVRTEIVPVDGWVDASTNDVGIQGSWYTYSDGEATIVPAAAPFFAGAGSQICISGSTVLDDTGEYWGAAVGMDFNVVDEVTYAYDATAHGVAGVKFTLTGTLPPGLQVNYTMTTSASGDTYCARYYGITSGSLTLSVAFDDVQYLCWYPLSNPVDPTVLKAISIQVTSTSSETVPFDFCVEDVSAIVE